MQMLLSKVDYQLGKELWTKKSTFTYIFLLRLVQTIKEIGTYRLLCAFTDGNSQATGSKQQIQHILTHLRTFGHLVHHFLKHWVPPSAWTINMQPNRIHHQCSLSPQCVHLFTSIYSRNCLWAGCVSDQFPFLQPCVSHSYGVQIVAGSHVPTL